MRAVQTKNEADGLKDDEVPDLWTAEGDSVRLPDGALMPRTLGELKQRYGRTSTSENLSGDDIDDPETRPCRFPYLRFILTSDDTSRTVPDSARITRVEIDAPPRDTVKNRFTPGDCTAQLPPAKR